MPKKMFMKADEVAELLDVSKSYAYKLIRKMNQDLKKRGCVVIPGRVDRTYFFDHFYGTGIKDSEEVADAGI